MGICAAGAVGKVVMDQVNKKQTESMRSMLSSQAGIDIDASILDEVLSTHRHHPLANAAGSMAAGHFVCVCNEGGPCCQLPPRLWGRVVVCVARVEAPHQGWVHLCHSRLG